LTAELPRGSLQKQNRPASRPARSLCETTFGTKRGGYRAVPGCGIEPSPTARSETADIGEPIPAADCRGLSPWDQPPWQRQDGPASPDAPRAPRVPMQGTKRGRESGSHRGPMETSAAISS